MTSLRLKLNDTYLVVPQDPVPTPSSSSPPSNTGASSSPTTLLKGNVTVFLSKPIKISSLSITLSGTTHIANLGPTGKRAHYSRRHLQVQHFILAPHSDPTQYYTLVQQNKHLGSSVTSSSSDAVNSSLRLSRSSHFQSTLQVPGIPNPGRSQDHIKDESLSFEFEIPVPNQIPTSVMTPQGGTIYRLTASMTMANKNKSRTSAAGLLSLLAMGPGQVSDSLTVQIYRAGSVRPCSGAGGDDTSQDDEDITPHTVSNVWPDQLDARATIAFIQLPAKSNPDIRVQAQFLGEKSMNIQSFQTVLWERAIYRVQKIGQIVPQRQDATSSEPPMVVIGVRNRIICTQSSNKPWLPYTSRTSGHHTALANTYHFSTPSSIRGSKDLYSVRNCNPSTFGGICRRGCCASGQEDASIQDAEFGDIAIEIQHFLKCSIMIQGVAPNNSSESSSPAPIPSNRLMEWTIGDIPVVLRGVPNGAEVDATGLPTYMGSFSTSVLSLDDALAYESGRVIRSSRYLSSGRNSEDDDDAAQEGSWRSTRRSSWASSQAQRNADGDDDDALSAVTGRSYADSGLFVLPGYEESNGRQTAEVSF
ncbi:hypothetical protein MVEG_09095 [Podila verticillata NRRL 6337]|nr:hypothetical protein MVEG_09095 [Podila verticillata NRRL 6337]